MRVVETDGFIARCDAKGIRRDVNLFLLQHETIASGDHVLVHVGYAIQKISEAEARSAWDVYDAMLAAEDAAAAGNAAAAEGAAAAESAVAAEMRGDA